MLGECDHLRPRPIQYGLVPIPAPRCAFAGETADGEAQNGSNGDRAAVISFGATSPSKPLQAVWHIASASQCKLSLIAAKPEPNRPAGCVFFYLHSFSG